MSYQPFPSFADWDEGVADIDLSIIDRVADRLVVTRRSASAQALEAVMTETLRTAAVDTGAIEGLYSTDRGFTRTVATQAAAWELAADEKGPHVRRSIEAAISGYELVLDVATTRRPVTQAWIRDLHTTMCAEQKTYRVFVPALDGYQDRPLPLGEYKQMPNSPTNRATGQVHDYAPPGDTPAEMARLVDELASPRFGAAHPVVQAAYTHYAFVCIHPFADGNGRIARAVASVFVYRRPLGVPLVVFADQRDTYLDTLEAADVHQYAPFTQFLRDRVVDTVNLVDLSLTRAERPDTAAIVGAYSRDASLHEAAARVAGLCQERLTSALTTYDLPDRLRLRVSVVPWSDNDPQPLEGYVPTDNTIVVTSKPVTERHPVFVNELGKDQEDILVVGTPHLRVWLREIDPAVTSTLTTKLDLWADQVAAQFVAKMNETLA
ncbi:MAG: Fic family protein [Micrococcales bacterium]|nr:Fic family protein [Micrococcales bacterium]MCL2667401.1 Fic family protein [Micrococcales bacterium]